MAQLMAVRLFHLLKETAMIRLNAPAIEEVQQEFVELLPELSSRLSGRFRRRNPEAREDAVAEGIGAAWQMYRSARLGGKTVTVSNLAFYAGRSVDAGRNLAGTSITDVLSEGTIARRRMAGRVPCSVRSWR